MTAPRRFRRPHPRHLLSRLQREWDRLAVSPDACARARAWDLGVPISSLHDVLRACGHGGEGGQRPDAVLRRLVTLAAADELAARVVLQRLLPAISVMGRRHTRLWIDEITAVDEALAAAWSVIRTTSAATRRRYVLGNMIDEIEYHAFRRSTRRKVQIVPVGVRQFEDVPDDRSITNASQELAELLRAAQLAGFDEGDVELAERLGSGESAASVAADRRVTDRTIRNHRAIVVHRLRQLALAG